MLYIIALLLLIIVLLNEKSRGLLVGLVMTLPFLAMGGLISGVTKPRLFTIREGAEQMQHRRSFSVRFCRPPRYRVSAASGR